MKTVGQIIRQVRKLSLGSIVAIVDGVGIGAGVVDRLAELGYDVVDFQGGKSAFDTERFVNQRSEHYWNLRVMFEDGNINIDPEDDVLAAQLGALKWSVNPKGKIEVERKEDYRKRTQATSPDRADAVMMACAKGVSLVSLEADAHDDSDEQERHGDVPYQGRNSDTGMTDELDALLDSEPGMWSPHRG
jgi:hypothetical protein